MELLYSDREIIVCIKPVGLDAEVQVPEKLKEMRFAARRLAVVDSAERIYAVIKELAKT